MNVYSTSNDTPLPYDKTSLLDLIRRKVDGSDYGLGQLETLEATVHNQTRFLAELIELLNLTDEQLTILVAPHGEKIYTIR